MLSISDILDTVQVANLIKDPVIKQGVFERNARGLRFYSGGFTVVFPVTVGTEKWAFRCWHADLGNVRNRFKIVADYINRLNSSYFCDLHYYDEGIIIEGKIYPTTRMRWVEGKTLNQYILDNKSNQACLLSLASEFITMIDFLHKHKIAHGDLQHGNIIVHNGEIKLVDYDSIFVPGLEGSSDIIIGKADFQHPKRKNLKLASAKLDYFSELIIYLSIIAIAKNPSLLNKYSLDDSLLFNASDWIDFKRSGIYMDLKDQDSEIDLLLQILEEYLNEDDISNLEPFSDLCRKRQRRPIIRNFSCGKANDIVYKGEESEIVWDVDNVTEQFIDDISIPIGITSQKRIFTNNIKIKLTLHNGLNVVSETKLVKVVDKPTLKLCASNTKLKKKKSEVEHVTLKWSVSNAQSVVLRCGTQILSESTKERSFKVNPQEDSTYELIAVGLDGKTEFKKSIKILVREPAEVVFKADKNFTLPGVPITLSWLVNNANSVALDGRKVSNEGKLSFAPKKDTNYRLMVKDTFGNKDYFVEIKMLPLPFIKSILVNTPRIDREVIIQYQTPQFEMVPDIPRIDTDFVKIDVPMIPNLKQTGLFVEIIKTPQNVLSQRLSKFFKRLFKIKNIHHE